MTLPRTVADVLGDHVTFELECIDRMYLNCYVPGLMYPAGVAAFFTKHRGMEFASSALMLPMTRAFVAAIHRFVDDEGVDLVHFQKGERKDDVALDYLAAHDGSEGIVFVGRAQEKTSVFRTERRRNPVTGKPYPWIVASTGMVNHFYFYGVDDDVGPFFIKFCSYFPYIAKVCINGHHFAQRQATKAGIGFTPLDNAIIAADDPARLQRICDRLSPAKIDMFVRKWLARLPHPFTGADRRAGYRYQLSVLQAEFSLTQTLDRPLSGRVFFEEVIRENWDLGRPSQVALIFGRRVVRRGRRPTPGRFRTKVVTEGVVPSLHVDYRFSRVKQYFKDGRALRTETVINNPRDFGIGKRLENLPALREVGFSANRRLLGVQQTSCDPLAGAAAYDRVCRPVAIDGQRVPALRFDHPVTQALLVTLAALRLLPNGFSNRDLRGVLAPLLGLPAQAMTQGRMSYHLRRLRHHGLIERIPRTHRYAVTDFGLRASVFLTRAHDRFILPGADAALSPPTTQPPQLRRALNEVERAIDDLTHQSRLAA